MFKDLLALAAVAGQRLLCLTSLSHSAEALLFALLVHFGAL